MSSSPLDQSACLVAQKTTLKPVVGVVLGSGLGAFGDLLGERIPYADLPGMPVSRVPGHAGNLRMGCVGEVPVACLQGRVHLYEGHGPEAAAFGARLLAKLGCRAVLLTNAAGGIAPDLRPTDLLLITDHLNLTGQGLVMGAHDDVGTDSFTDMTDAYDPRLRDLARNAARDSGVVLHEGVYAGTLGPVYEAPAEVRMLRTLGADAVGMSTVIEVAALRQLGVRVAAISCITNLAAGVSASPLSHRDVQAVASRRGSVLVDLLIKWVMLVGNEVSR
jgi:purine-nucleoside phosphorylase